MAMNQKDLEEAVEKAETVLKEMNERLTAVEKQQTQAQRKPSKAQPKE